MVQFHETMLGKRFYEAHVPSIAKSLSTIAMHLQASTKAEKAEKIDPNEVARVVDALDSLADGEDDLLSTICNDAIGLIRKLTV